MLNLKSDYYDMKVNLSKGTIKAIINSYFNYMDSNGLEPEIERSISPKEFVELPTGSIDHVLYYTIEFDDNLHWLLDIFDKPELEKFECPDCGCYFMVEDRNDFICPNCEFHESNKGNI